jgi:hypothetical protein
LIDELQITNYELIFVFLTMVTKIAINSLDSFNNGNKRFSSFSSVAINNFNQYFVSLASFNAIFNL